MQEITTVAEFWKVLPRVDYWTDCLEGLLCGNYAESAPGFRLSNGLLQAVHPKLPAACKQIIQRCVDYEGSNYASGAFLRCQLQHWVAPFQVEVLKKTNAVNRTTTYWVHQLYSMTPTDAGVQVQAGCYALSYHSSLPPERGVFVDPYVVEVCDRTFTVDASWLDERYPDWHTRLGVTKELGCSPEDTARFVQGGLPAVKAMDLSGLQFD